MGQSILVVEDEEITRGFLGVQLSKLGYQVLEAEDGEKALLQLDRKHFDLVISDTVMPNKDGWQLMREIKESPKTRDVPIILITSENEDADMLRAYDNGAAYYISKPFTIAQLFYGIQMASNSNRETELRENDLVMDGRGF